MDDLLHKESRREFFYALYSRIFLLEADEKLLQTIEDSELKEYFPNYFTWDSYKELPKSELIGRYLNVDFTDISLLHIVPYESFYVRDDAMIESGGDNPIYEFYERFNFVVQKDVARVVSPDHIAIEMEFMHRLIDSSIQALKEDDQSSYREFKEIQREFLQKHILQFASQYFIAVKSEASTPFYHDSAMMALEFLLSDYQTLSDG
jgi:TorA maturation chaperone TorD